MIRASRIESTLDSILGALTGLFAEDGAAREVAVLALSKPSIAQTGYDNWDGGQYGYTVYLQLEPHFYSQLSEHIQEIEERLLKRSGSITRLFENEDIQAFVITTELVNDPQWREKAKTFLTGQGLTNQGRARSDNLAPRQSDGLLFRSNPEIHLYRAFKALGVTVAPLPVFIRGGKTYRRVEPDFFIVHGGMCLIVEVDGDTVHHETPEEAQNRLIMLTHEGVQLHRVKASDCDTPDKARACAESIMHILKKMKSNG